MAQTIVSGVQHQLRRGSFSQVSFFTGMLGEVVFDTTYNRLSIQDGSLAGGYPASMASVFIVTASATIPSNVSAVHVDNNTGGSINITLPSAASFLPGQVLTVLDVLNGAGTHGFTLHTASTADQIYSTSGTPSTSMNMLTNGQFIQLISNSSNKWVGVIQL